MRDPTRNLPACWRIKSSESNSHPQCDRCMDDGSSLLWAPGREPPWATACPLQGPDAAAVSLPKLLPPPENTAARKLCRAGAYSPQASCVVLWHNILCPCVWPRFLAIPTSAQVCLFAAECSPGGEWTDGVRNGLRMAASPSRLLQPGLPQDQDGHWGTSGRCPL